MQSVLHYLNFQSHYGKVLHILHITITYFTSLSKLQKICIYFNTNYSHLCENLNGFYKDHWHRWRATSMHDNFSTPWRTASTIVAVILLLLTLIQAAFSIIQVA